LNDFVENFDKDDEVFQSYLSQIKEVKKNNSYRTVETLRRYLKATIANELFGDVGFYRIIHQNDKMLQKVLEMDAAGE
jgi:carboxyl-terminal processing protease